MSSDLLQLKAVSLPNCTCTYNTIIPSSRVAAFVLFPPCCMSPPSLSSIMPYDSFPTDPTIRQDWSESPAETWRESSKCSEEAEKVQYSEKNALLFFKDEVGCLIKAGWAAKKLVVEIMEGLTFKVSACLELNEVKSCCGSKKNVCSIYQGQ